MRFEDLKSLLSWVACLKSEFRQYDWFLKRDVTRIFKTQLPLGGDYYHHLHKGDQIQRMFAI